MREHGTKITPVFLPADGEASWLLLLSSVSVLSSGTVQPENINYCILKEERGKPKRGKHEHLSQLSPALIYLSQSQLI